MAILLTAGTGKTSTRIASLIQSHQPPIPFLLTSRRGPTRLPPDASLTSSPTIKFDWLDSSTYSIPFEHQFPDPKEKITAVYLVRPEEGDAVALMTEFINLAVEKYGVKRFVLMAGTSATLGGPKIGQVWERLDQLANENGKNVSGISYCVLRPTWFMENFSAWQHFGSLKNEGKIYTSCEDGRIPFVAVKDIAAVAFYTLTAPKLESTDYPVRGPELLTFDKVAEKFTRVLGRPITHVRISEEDNVKRLTEIGLSPLFASYLPQLEVGTANGQEDNDIENPAVELATGKKGTTLEEWFVENKHVWD